MELCCVIRKRGCLPRTSFLFRSVAPDAKVGGASSCRHESVAPLLTVSSRKVNGLHGLLPGIVVGRETAAADIGPCAERMDARRP